MEKETSKVENEVKNEVKNENNETGSKIKTRQGSGYLKQLYSTARSTASTTHSHLKNLTTFLVNFVPTEKVDASELQVRVHFDDAEIDALSHSIKEHGVLQPILVVQDGDRYKVIAGERRLRAAKQAGIERIPARVLSTNDKATHEIALRENLDRVDLHPLEEGEGYVSLLDAKAYASHDAIAKAFGKPKSRITECIGFTKLPELTKQALLKKGLKGRALLRQLLTMPEETHASVIEQCSSQEDVIPVGLTQVGNKTVESKGEKKAPRPFAYICNEKTVSIPAFRWKKGETTEKLESYIESLRTLLTDLEKRAKAAS